MKVALIQLAYGDDESLADRTERVTALVRAQAGHDLVQMIGGKEYTDIMSALQGGPFGPGSLFDKMLATMVGVERGAAFSRRPQPRR